MGCGSVRGIGLEPSGTAHGAYSGGALIHYLVLAAVRTYFTASPSAAGYRASRTFAEGCSQAGDWEPTPSEPGQPARADPPRIKKESEDDLADPGTSTRVPTEDPLMWISRLATKLNSKWLKLTYPFDGFGRGVSIHHTCEVRRSYAHKIRIEDSVLLDREVWLNVPVVASGSGPAIIIGRGANVGRRSTISARNQVCIQENVLFAPGVFVTDHNHQYSDPRLPISEQGVSSGGRIVIEQNCWLGYGSMILAGRGELIIGRNSVVGAYSVVTQSCPPYSVLVGNPAQVVSIMTLAATNG